MSQNTSRAWWDGNLKEGRGGMAVGNDVCKVNFSFRSRFEQAEGSNPEQMLAAAHAGCFSMALSNLLGEAGHLPSRIDSHATVDLQVGEEGPEISRIHLRCDADVPGIRSDEFQQIAEKAKRGCPVSKLFKGANIELDAKLVT